MPYATLVSLPTVTHTRRMEQREVTMLSYEFLQSFLSVVSVPGSYSESYFYIALASANLKIS